VQVTPKIDLKLNWKKENKFYSFSKNINQVVPDDVANYLLINYKDKFSILNEQTQKLKSQNIEFVPTIPIIVQNGLDELVKQEDSSKNIKTIIEESLLRKIIIKNGSWFNFDGVNIAKGINNLKTKLEEDDILLKQIKEKLI
jgi:hypothetical protein